MRDILKFSELGKEKRDMHRGYDLMSSEAFFLGRMAVDKDLFEAIMTAYYSGLESGYRMGKKYGK